MAILLVVDMQPRFRSSTFGWMLKNVADEIRAAKLAGWGIIFLEYTRSVSGSVQLGGVQLGERTHGRLTRLVMRYKHAITVHKKQDDGSIDVLHAADMWYDDSYDGSYVEHIAGGIRVVGVNTSACIASTVNGLSKSRPDIKITVVGKACNNGNDGEPNNMGQKGILTDDRNVTILKAVC